MELVTLQPTMWDNQPDPVWYQHISTQLITHSGRYTLYNFNFLTI